MGRPHWGDKEFLFWSPNETGASDTLVQIFW